MGWGDLVVEVAEVEAMEGWVVPQMDIGWSGWMQCRRHAVPALGRPTHIPE